MKDEFDKEFALRVERDGKEKASDSNAGAIYKIRAVKNGKDTWDGIVRCGYSGELLLEQVELSDTWESCLILITNMFTGYITESCDQLFAAVVNNAVK